MTDVRKIIFIATYAPAVTNFTDEEAAWHEDSMRYAIARFNEEGTYQCEWYYLTNDRKTKRIVGIYNIPFSYYPISGYCIRPEGRRQFSFSLLKALVTNPPDLVVMITYKERFSKLIATVLHAIKVPYVSHVGGWITPKNRWQRRFFHGARAIMTNTDLQRQLLIKEFQLDKNKVRVVPYGVDTNTFLANRSAKGADTFPTLLYAGRIFKSKGVFEVVKCISELKQFFPQIKLYIVGRIVDHMYYLSIVDYIAKQNLKDNVIILDHINNRKTLAQMYASADVFVFPSTPDCLPSVCIESMACGTPPIALYGSGGVEEVIDTGENGILTQLPNLSLSIYHLLTSPNKLRQMGENAVKKARAKYPYTITYSGLRKIFLEVLR